MNLLLLTITVMMGAVKLQRTFPLRRYNVKKKRTVMKTIYGRIDTTGIWEGYKMFYKLTNRNLKSLELAASHATHTRFEPRAPQWHAVNRTLRENQQVATVSTIHHTGALDSWTWLPLWTFTIAYSFGVINYSKLVFLSFKSFK